MTITVDTSTEAIRTGTGSPTTISHGGASSGVKGVVVAIMHGTSATDHISAVTYGGVALARQRRDTDPDTEPGAAELWFLGAAVPQGTQDCVYTSGATTDDIDCRIITLLAATNLQVSSVGGISDTEGSNPGVLLATGGRSGMAFAAMYSGLTAQTSITAGTDCTKVGTGELSGNFCSAVIRQTTGGTGSFTVAATSSGDDLAFAAMMVVEAGPIEPPVGAAVIAGLAPTTLNSELNRVFTPDPAALAATGTVSPLDFGFPVPPFSVEQHLFGAGPSVFVMKGVDDGGGGPGLMLALNLNMEAQPPVSLEPPVGEVTVAGLAPTLDFGYPVPAGSLAVTGTSSVLDLTLPMAVGSLAFTGLAPTPSVHISVGVGGAVFTGYEPSFIAGAFMSPDAAALAITGLAPLSGVIVSIGAGAVSTTGLAPTFSIGTGMDPGGGGPGLLVALGLNLDIPNFTPVPAPAELAITGYEPGIGLGYTFSPAQAALAVTGLDPNPMESGSNQHPVMEAPVALAITGHQPTVAVGLRFIFEFPINQMGFVGTPITGTAYTVAGGNPALALTETTTGNGRNNATTWTITTDFAGLGVPANTVITAIGLASSQHQIPTITPGTATAQVRQVLLTPTGFAPIEISQGRAVTSTASPTWVTNTGAGASSLQIPSGTSLTITAGATHTTPGGGGSKTVVTRHDNITFVITYTAAKVVDIPAKALAITGLAPTVIAQAAASSSPPTGALAISGAGPTISITAAATGGGGGPGLLVGLALNLEQTALGPAQLVITGYAPAISRPIFVLGSDILESARATLVAGGAHVISGSSPTYFPAAAALAITGLAPTLALTGSRLFDMPVTALTITVTVPTLGIDRVIEIPAGSLTFDGLGPSDNTSAVVSPAQGLAQFTGYAPELHFEFTIAVGAGAITVAGQTPVAQGDLFSGPFAGVVTTTGYAPFVVGTDSKRVEPPIGTLAFTGYEPAVGVDHVRSPAPATLTIDGLGPSVPTPEPGTTIISPLFGAGLLTGYEPTVLLSVEVATATGSASFSGLAPTFVFGVPRETPAGSLAITGFAPLLVFATINGTGDIASQRATSTGSGHIIRVGSGTLQSQQPLSFVSSATYVHVATGDLQSGPASLSGTILPVTASLQSGRATLKARVRLIPFKPHKKPKPHRVNRFNVALKPRPRMKFRKNRR